MLLLSALEMLRGFELGPSAGHGWVHLQATNSSSVSKASVQRGLWHRTSCPAPFSRGNRVSLHSPDPVPVLAGYATSLSFATRRVRGQPLPCHPACSSDRIGSAWFTPAQRPAELLLPTAQPVTAEGSRSAGISVLFTDMPPRLEVGAFLLPLPHPPKRPGPPRTRPPLCAPVKPCRFAGGHMAITGSPPPR